MSRRLPALTLVAVLSLLAAALGAPLLPTVAAAAPYGSHVFQANPIVVSGAQSYSVYAGSTVAQSIFVNQTYHLENLTLLVVNNGSATNALNVSIHPDNPMNHLPVMPTSLAWWSEVIPRGSTPVTGNWTFNPAPLLEAGQTYWIVATNSAPQAGNGYEWFSTNGDTYSGGHALLYSSGSWSGLPYDLYFVTFGQEYDANLSPAMTVDRVSAQPGDFATFTIWFNNTGASTARDVWVNDTLDPALTNASLGFPGVQPVSAATFPNLVFPNVTNGPHSFSLTAQIAIGTAPDTLVANAVTIAYVNVTGAVLPAGVASASVLVGLATKQLYLAGTSAAPERLTTAKPTASTPQTTSLGAGAAPVTFVLSPALAQSFHAMNASATLWLRSQKLPPQTYHIILSLLDNATTVASVSPTFKITASGLQRYFFAFALSNYSFGRGHRIGLSVTNLGGGGGSTDALVMAYNSTLNSSRLDLVTDTYISIRGLSLENQDGPTPVWSTLDSLVVQANVSDPFGESRIQGVWINITAPSGQPAASGGMSTLSADPSSLPAWELLGYTLAPPLETGRYRVIVSAVEDNGVSTLAEAWANVSEPSFTLENTPSQNRVVMGDTFAYYVDFNNTGSGLAGSVWINDTLPAGLSFITSNLSVSSVSGSTYTWALQNVSVGPHRLEIDVRVATSTVDWVLDQATLDARDMSKHPLPSLWSNASVFLNGPIISVSLSSVPSGTVHANETVTYRITLVNSGAAALQLWLNDTLPAGFMYDTTTAGTLGGTWTASGSVVSYFFSHMPANTSWTFNLVATAGPALVRNATYTNGASLAYTSLSGNLMPYAFGSVAVTAVSPWIPGGLIGFVQGQVLPGSNAAAIISFNNLGNEAASHVWINLTLDPRLAMVNASMNYTTGVGFAGFALAGVGVGLHRIYLNLSVSPTAPDRGALTILGTLDARDGFGNRIPTTGLTQGTIYVRAAQLTLAVTPGSPVLEAGVPYPMHVSWSNGGSDTAANVWLNLTLPSSLEYVNDTFPVPPVVSGLDYSWHQTNLSAGSFSMELNLEPRLTIANGTRIDLSFHLDYQGSNLQSLPGVTDPVKAIVVSPVLLLTVKVSTDKVVPGGILVYTLQLTNTGMATAESVFLVDKVDSQLQVVTYDAAVEATKANATYNWTFTGVAPGMTQTVNLTVRVEGNVSAGTLIPNVFEATYTNSAGVVLGRVRSSSVTVSIVTDLSFLGWVALGAAALAGFAFMFVRRRKVEIEEVFLVYRDGVLISHLSRTLLREKDEDVLSGMLTAVQEFVREAFQYGEHRDLHQLDFGDYRILIERGKYVFLAVVYSGKESLAIRKKVRAVIDRIEHEFGTALAHWEGDMEEVIGARDLIRDTLLGSSNHNHTAKTVVESE